MLPGLRFLFAAIVLSMSILIFGLGAAALLRAAHEEVASAPSRRAIPETRFAAPAETATPTLALLRVEPLAVEAKPAEDDAPAKPEAQPAVSSPPAERIAALKPEDASLTGTVKTEIPPAQPPAEARAAPPAGDTPAASDETRTASTEPVAATSEAAATPSEPAGAPASAAADMAATKIAMLGGPPVAIETPAPAKAAGATAEQNAVKKRKQAQRSRERRRIAQRAQLARQAASQQAADPFSQPAVTTRAK